LLCGRKWYKKALSLILGCGTGRKVWGFSGGVGPEIIVTKSQNFGCSDVIRKRFLILFVESSRVAEIFIPCLFHIR
jgi:hypothetical protein